LENPSQERFQARRVQILQRGKVPEVPEVQKRKATKFQRRKVPKVQKRKVPKVQMGIRSKQLN